jgi:hypothetical protein
MKQAFILILALTISTLCTGQNLEPAPNDKAVVYFVRTSSMGFAINFSYFDSTKLIGRFNGPKYIRYECDPGKHLFWARSENRDFIHADLDAGKIYFVEAVPTMGAAKAAVMLLPIQAGNPKKMKPILKLLNKKPPVSFSEAQIAAETIELADAVQRGMERYAVEKAKGKKNMQLKKDMHYTLSN